MKINGAMLTLAREYRALTQEELATRISLGQATIAKIEGGLKTEIQDGIGQLISDELGFPPEFFSQEEELLGFGSSNYFYRKRATLPAPDRKRIHGVVNLLRIALKRILNFVEIKPTKELQQLDLEQYDGDPEKVARAVRVFWNLPDGAIKDMTAVLEAAGIIVVPCDFKTRAMDATSMRLANMPPLIFINQELPGDRWRYTLAHELAHLVMHDVPSEFMEVEADKFAAEFLMPAREIRPQFVRLGAGIRLIDFANLKAYWRVVMSALIRRARDLSVISQTTYRKLIITMSSQGWMRQEPVPLEREKTKSFNRIVGAMTCVLGYSPEQLAKLLCLTPQEQLQLFSSAMKPDQPKLRLVSYLNPESRSGGERHAR